MRWTLGLRAVLVVPILATAGLLGMHAPAFTGLACLTALLILLADYRGPDQIRAYLGTAAGCLLLTGLGVLPLPDWLSVVVVCVTAAALGVVRGFSGYFASASVTLSAQLLIAIGLRSGGASAAQVLGGALVGALGAVLITRLLPGPSQPLWELANRLRALYNEILAGRRPYTDAAGTSHELVGAYVVASDRPGAPTRRSAEELMALYALAATGDALARGDLHAVAPQVSARSQWRGQLRVRMRPDGILFRQALIAAVLYGGLTWLVLSLRPEHPQWILLGAVTATYPYARRSAVIVRNLLLGTVLAFGALFLVAPVANTHPVAWWTVFVLASFVACGAPSGQAGWVLGQAAFTVLSLSLLGLSIGGVHLPSLQTRLENVLIGGLCAVAVAVVLAPRRIRARYQRALADLYEAGPDATAHFLRCADLIEAMRGSTFVPVVDLTDWLDAARLAPTAPHREQRARALRANEAVPAEPLLVRLSPLLPRSAFSASAGRVDHRE